MDNFSTLVDWDSDFFNKKIAKIVVNDYDEKYIEKKLSEYKSLNFDLVYIFLTDSTILSDEICHLYNCKLVDCKVIYELYVDKECKASPLAVEYTGAPSQLYELAFISGVSSRYRIDLNFKENEFKKLYSTWVDNSVSHLIANKVFVVESDNGIDGFITVNIDKDTSSIGLIASAPEKQGQGIGSLLISTVKRYVKDVQAPRLSVATQKWNSSACAFYEKNGFSLKNETNIYHAWLKK